MPASDEETSRIARLPGSRTSSETLITPAFVRVFAFSFTTFFSAFQLFPVVPFRILDLGGSTAAAGSFLGLYTAACALSAPLTGAFADHAGRKRVLVGGASLFVLFSLLYGVVEAWPLLLVVAAFHGVFWSAVLSSSGAVITETIPESRRTEGIAIWGLASTAAVAVAPAVGLAVYRSVGWFGLCLEMSALSAAMAVLASRVRGGESRAQGPLPPFRELIDLRVMAAAISLLVVAFGYGAITSYVALLSIERRITPPSLFFTVFALSMILVRFLTARLGDAHGPRALLFPSLALIPPAVALVATSGSRSSLAVAAVIFGAGFGGAYPGFASWALAYTDPQRRGATFGAILWAFDSGIGLGSIVTGQLAQRFGYRVAFLSAAAVGALAIPLFLVLSPLVRPGGDRPRSFKR